MSLSKVYVQNVMHAKLDIEVVISRVPCSLARPGHVLPPARLIILPGKSRAAAVRTRMRRADRLSMSVYRGWCRFDGCPTAASRASWQIAGQLLDSWSVW